MRSVIIISGLFLGIFVDHFSVKADAIEPKIDGDALKILNELNDNMKLLINRPCDCQEIYDMGYQNNGVYTIFPSKGLKSVKAYCEMNSGVGWTIFLNRLKVQNQITFKRGFHDYIHGFGNLTTEHWLGLDTISEITSKRNYKLRIEVVLEENGHQLWGEYNGIRIHPLQNKYDLRLWNFNQNSTMLNVMDQKTIRYIRPFAFAIDFRKEGDECGESEFMCKKSNICIPLERRCDHITDCDDRTDELDCEYSKCKKSDRCPQGDCITFFQRCDENKDCNHGRDEEDCDNRCSHVLNFLCNTGECLENLHDSHKVDGHPHCTDYTDEQVTSNKASNGTGGFWFHHTNYIYPTDEYDSEFFTIAVNEGGVQVNKKLSAVKYMITPYQPPLHSVFKKFD